jgi:DNA-binding FrmR family transcriptional regulator
MGIPKTRSPQNANDGMSTSSATESLSSGRTAVGRATIGLLKMNAADRRRLRERYWVYYLRLDMAHVIQNKKKLLARISRIRGQINGIEKALNEERERGEVLLTLAACRGAMNALMAEILEGHVRLHLLQSNSQKDAAAAAAGEELIEVIKRYLK